MNKPTRKHQIQIEVTDVQRDQIRHAASVRGIPVATFVRMAGLQEALRMKTTGEDKS